MEFDIDGEKGAQIRVAAKKTVTDRCPPDCQYGFHTNNTLHLYVTSPHYMFIISHQNDQTTGIGFTGFLNFT